MDVAEKTEAVRAEKTSDQLEILDVKKYPSLYGRLFIESVIPETDMMDPDLAPPNLRFLATPHDIDNRSYNHIFEGLSIMERQEQWKGTTYNDAYIQWRGKFTDFMKGIKDQKRIEALRVIAGKEPSAFGVEDANKLFADFSRDKTDVTSFAKRVVANLVQNGKVDPANLKALLPHIEWIASGIFGEKTAGIVNRVIEIEAQLQNNAKDFGTYLYNASPGKPELMSEERSILAILHSFRKGEKKENQQPPTQTQDDEEESQPETKQESQEKVSDEKPPAPPAEETEDADKKPDTSQEKQETTIKVVMTENDKGEAQFKLTANGKEITIDNSLLWLDYIDENGYTYLEVPSGIAAGFDISLPNGGWERITVVGGQGVKLNLKTLKTLETLKSLQYSFIVLYSAKSEFRDDDLSKRAGQVFKRRIDAGKTDRPEEWITQEDLERYLQAITTANPTPDSKTDKPVDEAFGNVVDLDESQTDLAKQINDKLWESTQNRLTFRASPDVLKNYLLTFAKSNKLNAKVGKIDILEDNKIAVRGIEISKMLAKVNFDLVLSNNGPHRIASEVQKYKESKTAGLLAKLLGVEDIKSMIEDIDSLVGEQLKKQLGDVNKFNGWDVGGISIDGKNIMLSFDKTTQK